MVKNIVNAIVEQMEKENLLNILIIELKNARLKYGMILCHYVEI